MIMNMHFRKSFDLYIYIYIYIKIFFVFTHILDLLSLSIRIFKLKDVLCVSEKHGMSISSHVFRNRERHKITHCYFFSLAMNILCLFLLSRLNKHEIIGSFILHQCTFYRNSYIEYFPTSQHPSSAHASYSAML